MPLTCKGIRTPESSSGEKQTWEGRIKHHHHSPIFQRLTSGVEEKYNLL
jgi:hypothetical protein